MPLAFRLTLAAILIVVIAAGAVALEGTDTASRALQLSLVLGAAFGFVLQRSRFCFYCNFRDFLERRDPGGLLAIVVALAVGAIGYTLVFGAWLPTPTAPRLPPTAHIGPVSLVLAGASFVFGIGMAISGSCLSAHFYRLGEGSPVAPFAIIGALAGFALGFATWNSIYLAAISGAQSIWLPHTLGYAGTLVLTLGVLAVIGAVILYFSRPVAGEAGAPLTLREAFARIFLRRWPAAIAGTAVGVISFVAYFRVAPLGVTAELGSIARTIGTNTGITPSTLFSLDTFRGCATVIKETLLSNNGLFVLGLIGAAWASALVADQFKPRLPTLRDAGRGLVGGLLLGWGAMTALGCTVGVLLSGIHAGAVSGWVFLFACAAGAAVALPLGRRLEAR